jgi:general secretion pathway protein K
MRKPRQRQSGIALFMVMSAIAVLTIVVGELSYSMHMQSRLAYNYTDGLKAYYNAKAAMKVGLLRLSLYKQVKAFLGNEQNRLIAAALPSAFVEKIWNFPFMYPIPVPDDASQIQKDALKQFSKDSAMEGEFQVMITSEASRLNMNNLLITTAPSPSPSASASPAANNPANPAPAPTPSPTSTATTDVDFKPLVEETINKLINTRRETDREFADQYREITGRDVMEAIHQYIKYDREKQGRLTLPGANEMTPKDAPLYSMAELHFIPGLDDTIYDLIERSFTVFATPGININTVTKSTLWSLVPEMKEEELNEIMKARDDPEQGKPFENADKFWEAVGKTAAGSRVETIKERLTKAGVRLVTAEESFRVKATAMVGQSTRNIEARVIFGDTRQNPQGQGQAQGQNQAQNPQNPQNPQNQGQNGNQGASGNTSNGLNLVYWRTY